MKKLTKWMNFEELDLLHPPLDFNFVCWVGFQPKSCLRGRNLNPIQGVRNSWQSFSCKGFRFELFFLCKFWGIFHHCKAIICVKKIFSWFFFVQGCYWDEGRKLSSWWFFHWKVSIGSIFTSKWKWWNFVISFEY